MLSNIQILFDAPLLFVDLMVNGLLIGAIFALVAFGMALVWGVMNIINIVQGEFVMLGGFITLVVMNKLGLHPLFGIPISAVVLYGVGWALYHTVIFRVVDKDMFISILATFGLSILIAQLSNQIFGADVRTADAGLPTLLFFNGMVSVSAIKLIAFILALVTGLGLWLFLKKSRLGQAIRATAQNPRAARILGIDTNRVYAATYGINAAICGAVGSLVVMAWAIQPYIGLPYTVRSFMVVIVAGLGNLPGVIVAGLGLGAVENLAGFVFGAEFQIAFVFSLMVVILVWRNFKLKRRREYLK
ncbi:branched-chain amino acid ABC transporter permease [Varunaivibrio sulfuroxidans]|uniref:Amino acid/amide ABC transporter membrane protein 1 (HAAT family) n=1 Tax=Varunaivibrio sulfuroxidans TaxID=1773489 RepID=A0A4R3JDY2_9PROT|nr:branched-chain amino acid ABC transporter permease [Varunaivibrio sulfuroxidans]TCS64062.1 amino acid/amide ABC transporter membrane protein 1 (HAAT family) [Varunaivibrio sulfuroxidans]WES31487.1 branched-chain amino acid ABC transporter permease [Varunaivibrio sulfuroxidans]